MARDGNQKSSGKNGQNKIFFNSTESLQKGKNRTAMVFEFQVPISFQFRSMLQVVISIPCLGSDLLSDL